MRKAFFSLSAQSNYPSRRKTQQHFYLCHFFLSFPYCQRLTSAGVTLHLRVFFLLD